MLGRATGHERSVSTSEPRVGPICDQNLELRNKTRYRQAVRNWKNIAFAALLLLVVAGVVIIRPGLSASEVDGSRRQPFVQRVKLCKSAN